jgi:hypothetical protein
MSLCDQLVQKGNGGGGGSQDSGSEGSILPRGRLVQKAQSDIGFGVTSHP